MEDAAFFLESKNEPREPDQIGAKTLGRDVVVFSHVFPLSPDPATHLTSAHGPKARCREGPRIDRGPFPS
jgi:hypothetical protein